MLWSFFLPFTFVGYENRFDWVDYLKETQSIAAPVELFKQVNSHLPFRFLF